MGKAKKAERLRAGGQAACRGLSRGGGDDEQEGWLLLLLCCSASVYGGTGRQMAQDGAEGEVCTCLHDLGGGVVADGLRIMAARTQESLALLARGPEGCLPSPPR